MHFRNPNLSDYGWLYKLAKERNKSSINIDFKMPTKKEHINWILKKNKNIFVIALHERPIGYIQLINSDIGIFILKKYHGLGYGKKALQYFLKYNKGNYIARINYKNKKSQRFFERNGFKLKYLGYEHKN